MPIVFNSTVEARYFFSTESRVDQTKNAQRWAVTWLSLDDFLLLQPCGRESHLRFMIIFCHARDKTFYECPTEIDIIDFE